MCTCGLGCSVGCASDWWSVGRGRVRYPPGPATFFREDWSRNIFYGPPWISGRERMAILSLPLIQDGPFSVSGERMRTSLVDWSGKVWLGKLQWLARHDLNSVGWPFDVKSTNHVFIWRTEKNHYRIRGQQSREIIAIRVFAPRFSGYCKTYRPTELTLINLHRCTDWHGPSLFVFDV